MQIIEKKSTFGGINTDVSLEHVGRDEYIDALNIRIGNLVEGEVGVITNVLGNELMDIDRVIGANKKCIGAYEDRKNGRIIFYIADKIGSNHGIYEFDIVSGAIVPILLGAVLNFTTNHLIVHINIIENRKLNFDEDSTNSIITKDAYEDMLFWVDRLNPPRQINIQMAKDFTNGGLMPYSVVNDQTISLIKAQPPFPPICSVNINDDKLSSTPPNLKGQIFQFRYKWVYANNLKSSLSPASERAYAYGENPGRHFLTAKLTYGSINVSYMTGSSLVKKIEIYAKNGSYDYQLILVVDKAISHLGDNGLATFQFINDGLYNTIDPLDGTSNFDDVPLLAGTQDLANGNALLYGDTVKGYDNLSVLDVSLSTTARMGASPGESIISNVSNPVWKESAKYKLGLVYYDEYGRSSGVQTNSSFVVTTKNLMQLSGGLGIYYGGAPLYQVINYQINHIPPNWAKYWSWVRTNNLVQSHYLQFVTNAVFDGGDGYTYFDLNNIQIYNDINANTFTSGNNLNTQVNYSYTPGDRVRIISKYNYKLQDETLGYYPIDTDLEVFSYGNVTGKFYGTFFLDRDLADIIPNGVGNQIYRAEYGSPNNYTSLKDYPILAGMKNMKVMWMGNEVGITKFPGFGDLKHSIRIDQQFPDFYTLNKQGKAAQATQHDLTYVVHGSYLKVRSPDALTLYLMLADQNVFIEIYTPAKTIGGSEPNIFYEFGDKNTISNGLHLADGIFGKTNQTLSTPATGTLTRGDSFLRPRAIPLNNTADNGLDRVNPTANDGMYIYDPSFSDFYTSNYTSNGRPQIYAPDNKQERYQTQISFSLEYNPDTAINRINTFYSSNFQEYDRNWGSIQRLYVEGQRLFIFQEFKVGWIPLNQQIIQSAGGGSSLTTSQNLLNAVKYYEYEGGICRNPESFSTSTNGYKYFYDQNNKNACRVAGDGIDVISDYGTKNLFFKQANLLSAQPNPIRVFTVYDRQNSELLISFEANGSAPALTLVFNEKLKKWVSRLDIAPDFFGDIYSNLYSFKDGALYKHDIGSTYNNFYGTQYSSTVTFVANEHPMNVKTFLSLDEQATSIWSAPHITTQLGQASNLLASDFQIDSIYTQKEGIYYASFLRDQNSPNGIMTGDFLKGAYVSLTLSNSDTAQARLFSVGIKSSISK